MTNEELKYLKELKELTKALEQLQVQLGNLDPESSFEVQIDDIHDTIECALDDVNDEYDSTLETAVEKETV